MARNTASYFRSLALVISIAALMQAHVARGLTFLPACRFSIENIAKYGEGTHLHLVTRGNGSVTLQDVVCICHISTPEVTVFYPQGKRNGSSDPVTSPATCEGVSSCDNMPDDFGSADITKFSKVNITGTFTQTAVIECGTEINPNKASPFIVWVEPLGPSASTNQQPQPTSSSAVSSSEIAITTTTTSEEKMMTSIMLEESSYFTSTTLAEASILCTTRTATTTLTTTVTDITHETPTVITIPPDVVDVDKLDVRVIAPTTTVISILIIIIVILLVALTVTIIIARSSRHKRDRPPISAVNNVCLEQTDVVEDA